MLPKSLYGISVFIWQKIGVSWVVSLPANLILLLKQCHTLKSGILLKMEPGLFHASTIDQS